MKSQAVGPSLEYAQDQFPDHEVRSIHKTLWDLLKASTIEDSDPKIYAWLAARQKVEGGFVRVSIAAFVLWP